jgi:hypothetical protein
MLAILALLVCARARAATIITDWTGITLSANYNYGSAANRAGSNLLSYNGKLWLIGGNIATGTHAGIQNDVWSTYNGIDWTLITGNAAFEPRSDFAACTFNGHMWVIAGLGDTGDLYYKDAWYSDNGIDWTAATRNAEFGERNYSRVLSYNGKMYMIMGTSLSTGLNFKSSIYESTDGVTWTQTTANCGVGARDTHAVAVHNNLMWIMGGENTNDMTNGPTYKDAWFSSNGADWTAATRNSAAGRRGYCQSVSFGGYLWMLAGFSRNSPSNPRDCWYSVDGVDWYAQTKNAEFGIPADYALTVYNNHMILIGGTSGRTDVWMSSILAVTQSPTFTITATPYQTRTITPTCTPTFTRTPTRTHTPTITKTSTVSQSPTSTVVVTKTFTPTITETHTASPTGTGTDTITPTWTISETHTASPTLTITPTETPIETLMIWHASNDTTGHKTDCIVCSRQYPDTVENPVQYTAYWQSFLRTQDYPHATVMFNEDDINPSSDVACWVMQGFVIGDPISMTFTATGGDLGISFMSNNITFTVGTP